MKDFGIVCLGIIIGGLIFYSFDLATNTSTSKLAIYRDTIYKVITPEPIVIEKVQTKIKYIRDTIIQTKPFIASMDTIVKRDTIKCYYTFPENLISMRIARAQDTLITHTINFSQNTIKKSPWWYDPLLIFGGFVTGYTIKSMEK